MTRLLLLLLCACLFTALHAQTREDAARDELRYGSDARQAQTNESGAIWYGAGAQLGFQGGNNQSSFRIGIAPIVGYKFNNFLSAGPRVSVVYNSYRNDFFNFKDRSVSVTGGLFTRAKIYRGFFAHAEYSVVSEKEIFRDPQTGDLVSDRVIRAIPFLGAGLSQGGGIGASGFEFLILFRVTQRDRINDAPYEIRTGFNYNF